MTAFCDQDALLPEVDDDDGMPPLVDNPYPPMTFTFAMNMTPITYGTSPGSFEVVPETTPQSKFIYSPPSSPILEPMKSSHAKKRDASYIPRPPNAFILFRSSFIRAQHIPGKIEGNHSALSKIIGKCWKALPREEREVWEAKAIVAQAEHRKKYPDWRFRPSANALAKVKDGPRRRNNRKGRGEAEKGERNREKRCAKIADLLVAGKKGSDLQVAIEAYDCETGESKNVKEENGGVVVMKVQEQEISSVANVMVPQVSPVNANATLDINTARKEIRSYTPDVYHDGRFKTSLTSMFRRSASAPASQTRNSTSSTNASSSIEASLPPPVACDFASFSASAQTPDVEFSPQPRVVGDITPVSTMTSTSIKDVNRADSLLPSVPGFTTVLTDSSQVCGGVYPIQCPDTYEHPSFDINTSLSPCSPAPTTPAFEPDFDEVSTPAQSPIAFDFAVQGTGDYVDSPHVTPDSPFGVGETISSNCGDHYSDLLSHNQSSYSSLKGWAGDATSKRSFACANSWVGTLPVAQQPMIYDPDRVMKDAFAAATVSYEEWGLGSSAQLSLQYPDRSFEDLQSLQHYAQGWQDLAMATGNYDDQYQLL
ncbi:unnamed protein product [Somion occarium]|uniref:HMG box domain-containing protein n=1 Tax=Somion occarium TaxID=3059160 RepID=A0ABP1CTB1_9APHY